MKTPKLGSDPFQSKAADAASSTSSSPASSSGGSSGEPPHHDPAVKPHPESMLSAPFIVKLDDVDPDDKHNPRFDAEGADIDELAEGMKLTGRAYDPIILAPAPKGSPFKYIRLAGSRRYFAALKLGWTTLEARLFEGTPLDAKLIQVVSNEGGKKLTSFELAMFFKSLRSDVVANKEAHEKEYGAGSFHPIEMITEELEKRGLIYSFSYVDNLIRCADRLIPMILERWREQDRKPFLMQIPTDCLQWLASLNDAAQQKMFDKIMGGANWKELRSEQQRTREGSRKQQKASVQYTWKPKALVDDVFPAIQHSALAPTVKSALYSFITWLTGPKSKALQIGSTEIRVVAGMHHTRGALETIDKIEKQQKEKEARAKPAKAPASGAKAKAPAKSKAKKSKAKSHAKA